MPLAVAACDRETGPAGSPQDGDDGSTSFAGMAACAECHAEQVAAWRGSHHDLAMAPADETTVLGDFDDAVFEHGGVTSRFFRRDGRFFVNTDGPDAEMADFELAWTFGAVPLQQYLVEFPDGRLQALGIAWDTRPADDGGQRWFHVYGDEVIPAGDELHWTQAAQNWNYMCADCHSTGYRKNYDPKSDTFASTWTDVDVACEACHGPGSEHVNRARQSSLAGGSGLAVDFGLPGRTRTLEEGATTLTIHGGEGGVDQVEACGRCHARRAPLAAEYRHGRPLLDSYLPAYLTDPLYYPDGQIRDEVYVYGSFRQSHGLPRSPQPPAEGRRGRGMRPVPPAGSLRLGEPQPARPVGRFSGLPGLPYARAELHGRGPAPGSQLPGAAAGPGPVAGRDRRLRRLPR